MLGAYFLFNVFGVKHQHELALKGGPEYAGQYGDAFGYVNALFSGCAFAGVVIALVIQTLEYSLAAQERREQLDVQEKIMSQQIVTSRINAVQTLQILNAERKLNQKLFLSNHGYRLSVIENARLRRYTEQLLEDLNHSNESREITSLSSSDAEYLTSQALVKFISVMQIIMNIVPDEDYGNYETRMKMNSELFHEALVTNIIENQIVSDHLKQKSPGVHQEFGWRAGRSKTEHFSSPGFKEQLDGYDCPKDVYIDLRYFIDLTAGAVTDVTGCYFDNNYLADQG